MAAVWDSAHEVLEPLARACARERERRRERPTGGEKERGFWTGVKKEREGIFVTPAEEMGEENLFFKMSCKPPISLGEGKSPRDMASYSVQSGAYIAEEKAAATGARRRRGEKTVSQESLRAQFAKTQFVFASSPR